MKSDRIFKILAIMAGFVGVLALSVGQFILAFACIALCIGILMARGGGDYNNRNLYNKIVQSEDGTIDGLYEHLKDTDTFLGRPWRGGYQGLSDDCIIFGPDAYKDCIVIAKNDRKKRYELMSVTAVSKITYKDEDAYRLNAIVDTKGVEVTPKQFSAFVAFQEMNAVLLDRLREETQKYADGNRIKPDSLLPSFKFFHYNSKEDVMLDIDDNAILCAETSIQPFEVIMKDMDGNELASIKGLSDDPKKPDKNGFDVFANGNPYGHIEHITTNGHDSFVVQTEDGEFTFESFIAVMRARVSSNYNVHRDGEYVATIANSTKIVFDGIGTTKLCVVTCYDDDYLVLYMLVNLFIVTLHNFLR